MDPLSKEADYDPQAAAISSAYVSAFNDYARKSLHYGQDKTYRPSLPLWKTWNQGMNQLSRFISLHPYFKVPPDKMPHLKAILPEFAAKTRNETGNLFYEFTINGDEVFCREGYVNAEALLAHLENVGAMLAQALTMADLIRIEVHGPAAELAKLKEPLAHLKPAWFELHS